MAINVPSPQEQERVQLQSAPRTRVQGAQAPQINTQFLNTLSQGVDDQARQDMRVADREEALRLRQQKLNDKYLRDKWSTQADDIVTEFKAQASMLQGENALSQLKTFEDGVREKLDALYENEEYKTANPELKQILDIERRKKLSEFRKSAIPHAYKQLTDIRNKASVQNLNNTAEKFIEYSSFADQRDGYLQQVKIQAMEDALLRIGEGDDAATRVARLGYVDKTISEAILGAINFQAKQGAVKDANDLFKRYKSQILPDDVGRAQESLNTAEKRNETTLALSLASQLSGINDEVKRDERLKEAISMLPEELDKGALYEKASKLQRADFERMRKARRQADIDGFSNAVSEADKYIRKGEPVPSSVIDSAPTEYQSRLITLIEKKVKDGKIADTPAVWNALYRKMQDGELTPYDVKEVQDMLSEDSYKKFAGVAFRNIERKVRRDEAIQNQTSRQYDHVRKRYIQALEGSEEFRDAYGKSFLKQEDIEKINKAFEKGFEELQQVKGLSKHQIESRLYKALEDSGVKITGQSDWLPFNEKAEIQERINIDTSPADLAQDYEGVHPDHQSSLQMNFFRAKGRMPTKAEMDKAIELLKATPNIDVSKPPQL